MFPCGLSSAAAAISSQPKACSNISLSYARDMHDMWLG
jgi:hypothetical protein